VDDLIDDLTVATNRARVRGTQLSLPSGGYVRAFLRIPYWNPPSVGELRFRPTKPAKRWTDHIHCWNAHYVVNYTLTMISLLPGFHGAEMWNPNSKMSEDCLYLNIWTPKLIYLYLCFQCTPIVKFVLIGHRLGLLYFLSLPDSEVVCGDDGMHDQRLALSFFSVTLFLFSFFVLPCLINLLFMLAASVGLHLLSPGSHGLFNRAILQSGSPYTPLAVMTQQQVWNRTLSLGRLMEDIINQQYTILSLPALIALPFTPSVDQNFLPDMPEVLLRTGNFLKTEVLIGSNQDEWTHFLVYRAPGYDITSQSLISREDFLKGVDLVFMMFGDVTREMAIFQYSTLIGQMRIVGRRIMISCNELSDHHHTYTQNTGGKPCLFLFDNHSSNNPWPAWMGMMQGYETEFIFGMQLNSTMGYIEEEVVMSRRMMKSWANMAFVGSITGSKWPETNNFLLKIIILFLF
uniref:Cholinesterase n=1 Tax=Salmo trutta TaxID=8032 RepID=A0A674BDW0_SALTR